MMDQPVTLFVGKDSDSDEAISVVKKAGIETKIVNGTSETFDFDPPLLISAWGVFDSLKSIRWFTRMATHSSGAGIDAVAGD